MNWLFNERLISWSFCLSTSGCLRSRCFLRGPGYLNGKSQTWHMIGLSPVWIFKWSKRLHFFLKTLLQVIQIKIVLGRLVFEFKALALKTYWEPKRMIDEELEFWTSYISDSVRILLSCSLLGIWFHSKDC